MSAHLPPMAIAIPCGSATPEPQVARPAKVSAQAKLLRAAKLLPSWTADGKFLMTRVTASQPKSSVNGLLRGCKIASKARQKATNPVTAVTSAGTESINCGSTMAAFGTRCGLHKADLSRELRFVITANELTCDPDPAVVPTVTTGSVRAVGRCLKSR